MRSECPSNYHGPCRLFGPGFGGFPPPTIQGAIDCESLQALPLSESAWKIDAWCADEGQKLHMVWRWIWNYVKRSPAQFKNDEVRRLKRILAGGSDSSSEVSDDSSPRSINVVADDVE